MMTIEELNALPDDVRSKIVGAIMPEVIDILAELGRDLRELREKNAKETAT